MKTIPKPNSDGKWHCGRRVLAIEGTPYLAIGRKRAKKRGIHWAGSTTKTSWQIVLPAAPDDEVQRDAVLIEAPTLRRALVQLKDKLSQP
jgi:hypothetical protein